MELEHLLKILNETRETFACTGLDREPDAKQVVDYIEARVRGAAKADVGFKAALMGSTQ